MSPVWWGLHDTLVPLDSTYGSPGPPKNSKEVNNKFSSDYFHILHVVGRIALEWNLFQNLYGALPYIQNIYDFCWPMYTDLRRPGDTFLRLRATEQYSYSMCIIGTWTEGPSSRPRAYEAIRSDCWSFFTQGGLLSY